MFLEVLADFGNAIFDPDDPRCIGEQNRPGVAKGRLQDSRMPDLRCKTTATVIDPWQDLIH